MRKVASVLLCIYVLAMVIAPSVQAQVETIAATLTDDTYYAIAEGGPNPLNGLEPTLKSGLLTMTFLKFNISGIPDDVTGISAVLELYTAIKGASSPHYVAVYKLGNNAWDESNPPAYVYPWVSLPILALTYVDTSESWYEWNVTNAVSGSLSSGSDAITFILSYPESSGTTRTPDITFISKEGIVTAPPRLTVTWTMAVPEFSALLTSAVLVMVASSLALFFAKRRSQCTRKKLENRIGENAS